jgi:hypothetical protein
LFFPQKIFGGNYFRDLASKYPHMRVGRRHSVTRAASNQLSCMSSGCHDITHDVGTLHDATFWKPE